MAYSNYRILLAAYITAIILDTATITLLTAQGTDVVWLSIPIIVLILLVSGILRMIYHPIRLVKMFLLSIRSNERMIRMPLVKDSMLQGMYDNMNEILAHYHENELTIETKKLYYDRILRIMTHEIRNTVTPIITLSDYYSDSTTAIEASEIREGMSIINSQSRSIKRFLDSYHTLTHLPPPVPADIHVPVLFDEMHRLFGKEYPNVKLIIHSPGISINADPSGIRIVLSNLLRNAMQSASAHDDGCVELRATLCENSPLITVIDNGDGIPQNRIKDIFLPFYTTKEHGNGIGLCLSRQIMRLHGGELLVESYPERRYTTFTMTFIPDRLSASKKENAVF